VARGAPRGRRCAARLHDLRGADPAALARYLAVMANGISVQAAAGANARQLREVAAIALANWPGAAVSKPKRSKEPA